MENIVTITSGIIELEKKIIDEKNVFVKKLLVDKLLFEIRNVNNKVNDYEYTLQNEIHKCCTHSFDNYFEKNEKTKTKCKICGYVLI